MRVINLYENPLIRPVLSDNLLIILYKDTIIKRYTPIRTDEVLIGKPMFEHNPIYTVQYTTTQGIPALNIFNHYDVPIFVNDRLVQPRCQIRYKGTYDNGIPYGEIFKSSYDEDVILTAPATNLHYGLVY
jgi:hypothetical protein